MSHDHSHGSARPRLIIALGLLSGYLVVQIIGGLISGSLSLIADAGHMASDIIGLVVALTASIVAARPATDHHTFGFRRVEVLGALVNGVLLTVVTVLIAVEAVRRLTTSDPADVEGVPMLLVAIGGLVVNIVAYVVLRGGDRASLGMRGAMLEVMGDMLGSVAAVSAGVVILTTGWAPADAVASLVIAALILPRAYLLLRDVIRVLTESAPAETSVADIRRHIDEMPGVIAVHDVHLWSITSGDVVFTAHVAVAPQVFAQGRSAQLLDELTVCLRDHFGVEHSTFQLEPADFSDSEPHAHD